MKKILLGTTALLGAATLANAALANTPKITVGGFADFQAGYVDQDNDQGRDYSFRSDTEISFKVAGKSDAGLGYGAEIWLEADTSRDADDQGFNASKTFLYMDGMWGRVEMGSNVGADATMKIDASSIARATGGIDGDFYYFLNSSFATGGGVPVTGVRFIAKPDLPVNYGFGPFGNEQIENVNKLTYYTPRWAGFQAGISYAVDTNNGNGNTDIGFSRGQNVSLNDGNDRDAENILAGGINWEGKFNNVGLGLSATGEIGDAEATTSEDLRAWNVGGKAMFMGVTVAASYGDWGDSLQPTGSGDDSSYWTAGAAYEFGPFGVSVSYLDSELDTTVGSSDFSNLVFGADYKLAPGLTPYAEVALFDMEPAAGLGVADDDGTVVLVGTQLNF